MTKQYLGKDEYRVWLDSGKDLILSKEELLEIQSDVVDECKENLDDVRSEVKTAVEYLSSEMDTIDGLVDAQKFDADEYSEVMHGVRVRLDYIKEVVSGS